MVADSLAIASSAQVVSFGWPLFIFIVFLEVSWRYSLHCPVDSSFRTGALSTEIASALELVTGEVPADR